MLTDTEKRSLAITVSFLLLGGGLKAWQRFQVRLGPFDVAERSVASGPAVDSAAPAAPAFSAAPAASFDTSLPSLRDPVHPSHGHSGPAGEEVAAGAGEPDLGDAGERIPAAAPDLLLARAGAALEGHPRFSPSDKVRPSGRKGGERSGHQTGRKVPPAGKVSLNRASAAELAAIPGIGAKTALAILEYRRSRGDFLDLKELVHVKGIGEKKLERIAPYLIISPIRAEEPLRQALLPPEPGAE